MLIHAYLRNGNVNGNVYVPTVVQLETGAYMDVEPVAVVPVISAGALRGALATAISKGNAVVRSPQKDKWPPPVLLKYAHVRSWSAFTRGAAMWSIEETGGNYQIVGFRTHHMGYWEEDPEQITTFPPGAALDEVIDRLVAILQEAARSSGS